MLWLLFILATSIQKFTVPSIDYKAYYLETYIKHKEIRYKLWALWPIYYDCWAVVTEALRHIWYRGFKLNSQFYLMEPRCKQPLYKAKKGDILINSNPGQWHVALITQNLGRGVQILDFVNGDKKHSTYRQHWSYSWVTSLSKDCLLSQKYWLDPKYK